MKLDPKKFGEGETITPVEITLTAEEAVSRLMTFINQTRRVEAAWSGGDLAAEVNSLREIADDISSEIGYDYDPTEDSETPFYEGDEGEESEEPDPRALSMPTAEENARRLQAESEAKERRKP